MAPIPDIELTETQTTAAVWTMLASAFVVSLIALTVIGCGCCGGKKDGSGEKAKGAEADDGKGGPERKAPEKVGVSGGDKMYRTMMAVDKEDFVASDKKEPSKKAAPGAYVDLGSVKKDDKKKEFASGRDPAYKSLMGVDDKFEPSAKNK